MQDDRSDQDPRVRKSIRARTTAKGYAHCPWYERPRGHGHDALGSLDATALVQDEGCSLDVLALTASARAS